MEKKVEKLIRSLEDKQSLEFAHYGKSDYFFFLEDAILEIRDLYDRWEEENKKYS